MIKYYNLLVIISVLIFAGCSSKKVNPSLADDIVTPANQKVKLAAPYQTKVIRNYCKLIGWPAGKTPVAPPGFKVNLYAGYLDNPRNIYVAPNGDIFVSQANTEEKGIKKVGAKLIGA